MLLAMLNFRLYNYDTSHKHETERYAFIHCFSGSVKAFSLKSAGLFSMVNSPGAHGRGLPSAGESQRIGNMVKVHSWILNLNMTCLLVGLVSKVYIAYSKVETGESDTE